MQHYITVTFDISEEDAKTQRDAIQLLKKKLELQPFSWTYDSYDNSYEVEHEIRIPA